MNEALLKLYAITDRSGLKDKESLKDKVEKAILGGVTIVQLREKHLTGEALKKEALEVKEICNRYGIPLIINDDVTLAKDIDADGVHVGQSDMEVAGARKILGSEKIIGATAKTVEQAKRAFEEGADYLGSGAIFGSNTKTDAKPMTMELLNTITQSVPIPVVAIGGIDASNASKLKGTLISGVAVINGIFGQNNVRYAASRVKNALFNRPVVQCITNHVTVNDVANTVLIMGASPIMAHHIKEVEEIQKNASALVLNLGATDDYEAMKAAMKTACDEGHPIVIDPVGVAVSSFRRKAFEELLSVGRPTCIRGNYSEILALYRERNTLSGLDDEADGSDIDQRAKVAEKLAEKTEAIVVASGETDIISDGRTTLYSDSGHPMLREITGSGCMLSASIASAYALCERADIYLTHGICDHFGSVAFKAAQATLNMNKGTMTFRQQFLDNL